MESTISPTQLLAATARIHPLRLRGLYTAQSASSERKNAVPEANASLWASSRNAESSAPATMAEIIHGREDPG